MFTRIHLLEQKKVKICQTVLLVTEYDCIHWIFRKDCYIILLYKSKLILRNSFQRGEIDLARIPKFGMK